MKQLKPLIGHGPASPLQDAGARPIPQQPASFSGKLLSAMARAMRGDAPTPDITHTHQLGSISDLAAELQMLRVRLEGLDETAYEAGKLCELAFSALDEDQLAGPVNLLRERIKDLRHGISSTGSTGRQPLSKAKWTFDLPQQDGAPVPHTVPRLLAREGLSAFLDENVSPTTLDEAMSNLVILRNEIKDSLNAVMSALHVLEDLPISEDFYPPKRAR